MTDPQPQPMTLAERARASREPSAYNDAVAAMLAKQCRWVHDASGPGAGPADKALAYAILQDVNAYVQRFSLWLLIHPNADALTSVADADDDWLTINIPVVWPLAIEPEP